MLAIGSNGVLTAAGLAITPSVDGASIIASNGGSVNKSTGANAALALSNNTNLNGGLITYNGTGSIFNSVAGGSALALVDVGSGGVNVGSAGTPVSGAFGGNVAINGTTDSGDQNVFLQSVAAGSTATSNSSILRFNSGSGNIDVTLTGTNQLVQQAGATGINGVFGSSTSGDVTIAASAFVGNLPAPINRGLRGDSASGSVSVSQTGGAIIATDAGIFAQNTGATGDVTAAQTAGTIRSGNNGILAQVQNSGAGKVHVTADGTVSGTSHGVGAQSNGAGSLTIDGSGNISSTNQAAILVVHSGARPAAGTNGISINGTSTAASTNGDGVHAEITSASNASDISVDHSGDVTGGPIGVFAGTQGMGGVAMTTGNVTANGDRIIASVANPFNAKDIGITSNGNVTANGSVAVMRAPYTDALVAQNLPTTGLGIGASTSGLGSINITTAAGTAVIGGNVAVGALINNETSAGNIVITANSTLESLNGIGIGAKTNGAGNATATAGDNIVAGAGGVQVETVNGTAMVNQTGGTINAGSHGIEASADDNGSVVVDMTGGQIGTSARPVGGEGIRATADGGVAGDITITSRAIFSTSDGIVAQVTNPAGTGGIFVTQNGAISVTGSGNGVTAVNVGMGPVVVASNAAIGSPGDGVHAEITIAGFGSGLEVTANSTISATQNGIFAGSQVAGNGGDTINVTTGPGSITGDANGFFASESNSGNKGGMAITVNGDVTGNGMTPYVNAPYADRVVAIAGTATGIGIGAYTAGTGVINITTAAGTTVTGRNAGIGALIDTGGQGHIDITADGNVASTNGTGIAVKNLGSGEVVIFTSGTVTSRDGISAQTGPGNLTITTQSVTATNGTGILAQSTSGQIEITTNGNVDATGGAAVDATSGKVIGVINNAALTSTVSAVHLGAGASLPNGIAHLGSITGITGIVTDGPTQVVNRGSIIGTGGTAILFSGGDDTLNLEAGYSITGNVIGNGGNDALVLSGSQNASFNVSDIGPAAQFQGFSQFSKDGSSTFTLTGSGNQDWTILAGGLIGDATSIQGNVANSGALTFNQTSDGTYNGVISGTGTFTKTGGGTLTISQMQTYTGATAIDAGTLLVDGSLASSSGVTVASGATLGGSGTVASTTISNGGMLSPGAPNSIGTLNVSGNLVLASAATYLVQVNAGGGSDKTAVSGAATLGGTLQVTAAAGNYSFNQSYVILTAGNISGTFSDAELNGFSSSFRPMLEYSGTDMTLVLAPNAISPFLPGSANANQRNVAAVIDKVLLAGEGTPFLPLFDMTNNPPQLLNTLSQLSGETAVGVQDAAYAMMGAFLKLMLSPTASGRDPAATGPGLAFASEPTDGVPATALGYAARAEMPVKAAAMPLKASPMQQIDKRWGVWGAGFGGAQRVDGDTGVGSNATDTRFAGGAAGLGYYVAPGTVVGVAVAGGGTSWSLANAMGSGRSDVFQAGAYGSTRFGPAYLSAAFGYGWHQASTDRMVALGGANRLEADFHPQVLAGRVEAGYRLGLASFGVTPYAAGQVQSIRVPGYSEWATTGSSAFALSYAAETVTDTRSELGAWIDRRMPVNGGSLAVRARAASTSAPSSATMNGTRWAIRPEMNATSRDSRSSLATTTGHLAIRAAPR
jgi:uncharacterized protein with beta-barrel porin domain